MSERFDVVVIGAGPAGEVVTERTASAGLRTALVEQELLGGECAYWACIPSKTLLRAPEVRSEARRAAGPVEPEVRFAELVEYRDYMIRNLDDSGEIDSYREQGIAVYKSRARLAGRDRVEVDGETLETDRIVIATGSETKVPKIDGLERTGYWTNREATTLDQVPDSVVVLGGGPVGIELAQFLCRMGARVTLVEAADRVLSREEHEVSSQIAEVLREDGIDLRVGASAEAVSMRDGKRVVALQGGTEAEGSELLVAVGRAPRVHDLGLETTEVEFDERGIKVDERCRAAEGIWAVGDVTGVMPFTHVGKYQARIVCEDIAGGSPRTDYSAIPRVVFCDPEVAAVGLTQEQAREQNVETAAARIELADEIARPWTYERDPRGTLELLADRERQTLVGAWAVSPLAGEWIHLAALAIKTSTPIAVLKDTVPQFPSYTEAYLKALDQLEM